MPAFYLELLQGSELYGLILGALAAGVISSLAPCSLLSVPLLISSATALLAHTANKARATLIFSALFALGVAVSFTLLAFAVAKFGALFAIAPIWAYLLAGTLALVLGLYALGVLGEWDRTGLYAWLLKLRYGGMFVIGMVFGLVSTPCATAPIVAIIALASASDSMVALWLLFAFALGHSMLLLFAGASVSVTQYIIRSSWVQWLSPHLNRLFAWGLITFALYFYYKVVQQL